MNGIKVIISLQQHLKSMTATDLESAKAIGDMIRIALDNELEIFYDIEHIIEVSKEFIWESLGRMYSFYPTDHVNRFLYIANADNNTKLFIQTELCNAQAEAVNLLKKIKKETASEEFRSDLTYDYRQIWDIISIIRKYFETIAIYIFRLDFFTVVLTGDDGLTNKELEAFEETEDYQTLRDKYNDLVLL